MKNKLITSLTVFLLLIPFRLPISILFVKFFKWIIGVSTTEVIPEGVLATNVIVTKIVYNIALSAVFLYNIEMFSREKLGRKAMDSNYPIKPERDFYWWVAVIGLLLCVFIVIDAFSVNDIFFL